jgi:flagellar biogenesis protein FliO
MNRSTFLVITMLLLFSAYSAAGAEPGPEQSDVAAFASPTIAPLTRLALAIGGIGALGWGLTLWSRRRRAENGGENARIQVLASRSVGPRHQVALLAVGDHRLLVGMGADSITTLSDLTAEASFSEELAKTFPPQREEGKQALLDVIGHFEGLDG